VIKSQQASLARERERAIQGMQGSSRDDVSLRHAAVHRALNRLGDEDTAVTAGDQQRPASDRGPCSSVQLAATTSFSAGGREVAASFGLNERQSIALRILCCQLYRPQSNQAITPQLCQFAGREGGTGKSRVIEAVKYLFARKCLTGSC